MRAEGGGRIRSREPRCTAHVKTHFRALAATNMASLVTVYIGDVIDCPIVTVHYILFFCINHRIIARNKFLKINTVVSCFLIDYINTRKLIGANVAIHVYRTTTSILVPILISHNRDTLSSRYLALLQWGDKQLITCYL